MTSRTWVVVGLAAASSAAALTSGRQMFFNLAYVWIGLLIVSYGWSRLAARGLRLRRTPLSNRGQVGHVFRERFFLSNRSPWSKLWVEVRDLTDLPGYRATALTGLGLVGPSDLVGHRGSFVVDNLGRRQMESWDVRTVCTRRGRYALGPTEICTADPFGLFPRVQSLPIQQQIVVLPPVVPVRPAAFSSGRLAGGSTLRLPTRQLTPNASTIREYAPGDSLNRIHWKSTARLQRLISKEFEFDPLADVWIVIDAWMRTNHDAEKFESGSGTYTRTFPSPDDPAAGLPQSTMDYTATIGASLAYHFIQDDRNVGLIIYSRARNVLQPGKGPPQLNKILESLAVVTAEGRYPVDEVVKIEAGLIPRGTTVFLISATTDLEVVEAAAGLRALGRQPRLIMLDALSFGGRDGNEGLVAEARRRGLPVSTVSYGVPLEAALLSV
jgi:uncharacterized protein (DUF58 family)